MRPARQYLMHGDEIGDGLARDVGIGSDRFARGIEIDGLLVVDEVGMLIGDVSRHQHATDRNA